MQSHEPSQSQNGQASTSSVTQSESESGRDGLNISDVEITTLVQLLNRRELLFVRRLNVFLGWSVIGLLALSLILCMAVFVLKTHQVDRQYFAYDSKTGRMVQIVPMDRPNMSTTGLLSWTMDCVERAHSYDAVKYRSQLTAASECFTSDGWNAYYKALSDSGNLQEAIDKRMIVTATRSGAAIVQKKGINPQTGKYTYVVRFPMFVAYEGQGRMPSQKLMMTVMVERTSAEDSPDGVGIAQIIGEPQS